MIFGGDRAARNRNIHAIEKRDRAQNKKPEDEIPADIARSRLRHGGTAQRTLSAPGSCSLSLEEFVELVGDDGFLTGLEHE